MRVVPVPLLSDNYGYLLIDDAAREVAVVDPVEPAKVLAAVAAACGDPAAAGAYRVSTILTTHSHWDHAGGNEEMAITLEGLLGAPPVVVGGASDGIPACNRPVREGDVLSVGGVSVQVLDLPCHTQGHVGFVATPPNAEEAPCVFTGDTLFVGGCGNFNKGTPAQMAAAFAKLAALEDRTRVFVGHNYTETNLRWALHVEPESAAVQAKLAEVRKCNEAGAFLHSSIAEEKQHNPFMRCVEPSVQAHFATDGDPVATMLAVRRGKDEWGRAARAAK